MSNADTTLKGTPVSPALPPAEQAGVGGFQAGQVVTVSAGHLVHDTYTGFLAPLLPVLKASLLLSNTQVGFLRAFLQWPSLLQPLIGYLSDRVSLRILFILAPAVTATMMSLLGVAPSYALLALLLIVAGASSASLHAVGPVMAGRVSGRNLGRGMSFWMVAGELGRVFGPLVVVSAVEGLGLNRMVWLMGAGFLASASLYVLLRDLPDRPPRGEVQWPWRRALRAMGRLLVPLAGLIVARAFLTAALTTFLSIFLDEEGADLWLVGAALVILEIAGAVGALLGGSVSDRIGRRLVLFISTLTAPLLLFLFLGTGGWLPGWLQFPLLLLLGFTTLSVSPVYMALVQESYPENRALANGLYMAVSFICNSGITVIVGVLGDQVGLRQTFVYSALITFLGLPMVLLLPRRRKGPGRGSRE